MKFDDIISHIGQFGPYQKQHYGLLCLPAVVVAIQNMMSIFILAQPEHRCNVPDYPNDTYQKHSAFHEQLIGIYIPEEDDTFSQCHRYDFQSENSLGVLLQNATGTNATSEILKNRSRVACEDWVYDQSTFESSIITELDLVCERKWSRSHAQMFLMLGSLCGAMFLGPTADYFGRKKIMMLAIIFMIGSSFAIAFTPSFVFLCLFFFLNGASSSTVYITTFVLGIELVGPQKRMYTGFIIAVFYGLGVVILSSVAYFIRNWQPLQLVLASFSVPFLAYYWMVPESARWLISEGRYSEAGTILKRAAHVNGRMLPEHLLAWEEYDDNSEEEETEPLWKIVSYPRLVVRALIISLNWMVCSMTYFGLGLNVGDLSGSIYANSIMYGVVEIFSYFVCIPLIDRMGRRRLHMCCMFIGGIACVVSPFPRVFRDDLQWLTVTLAVIGKFGGSGAFATIWMYTSELYPTVVRNSGVSTSALTGFLGGVIAPYVANLSRTVDGEVSQLLPLLTFGSASLVAGCLALFLPETKNCRLPDTLREANEFGRNPPSEIVRSKSWNVDVPCPTPEDIAGQKALIKEEVSKTNLAAA